MTVTRLIRDKKAKKPLEGVEVVYLEPGSPAHKIALIAKMHEEVSEIEKSPTDQYEYGDVLQALCDYGALHGIDFVAMVNAMNAKRSEFGGFREGAVMVRK